MRVVAGKLGGRVFDTPGSARTHPMSEKARGALFNMLGDIADLAIFDPFAGSGGLSFEAASRGAGSVLATERDRVAQTVIARNINALGLGNTVQLVRASANSWLQTNPDALFDIILCDPPYQDLQPNLLQRLVKHIRPDGLMVISWPAGTEPPKLQGVEQLRRREHGDLSLLFYRKSD